MASANPYVLQLKGIVAEYGSVQALEDVDLNVRASEIHAVVGEHGAGKSSMGFVISGFIRPTCGSIWTQSRKYDYLTPEKARQLGIEMVTQHTPLFNHLSVANNLLVSNPRVFLPFYTDRGLIRKAQDYFDQIGVELDPAVLAHALNLSERALVDFLKHLYLRPRLLILDETIEKLSTEHLNKVLPLLKDLRGRGGAVLFITHRIDDIYQLADRVTILRDGRVLRTDSIDNIDKINLIRLAYTQIIKDKTLESSDRVFYDLLKYNEAILTRLPVVLAVVDKQERVRLTNESAKTLFGFEDTHETGQTLGRVFSGRNREFYLRVHHAITNRKETTFYNQALFVLEKETINNVKTLPIFDGNYYIGAIITIEDITIQERLRQQVVLSENLSSIGMLAAGVAHEINNPLDIINYYLHYLRFNTQNPKIIDAIDNLEEETNVISQIVGNLITFTDKSPKNAEEVHVNTLLEQLVDLIEITARKSSISIQLEASEDDFVITANKTEIRQAILNIIRNSLEAMVNGGSLIIRTAKELSPTQSTVIVFEDTGSGIARENLNEVFLPFFTTKGLAQGNMGLGLSISYGIAKKYGGTITVENRREGGCRFRMTFPLIAPASTDLDGKECNQTGYAEPQDD